MKYHDHLLWKVYESITAIAGYGFIFTSVWFVLEETFPSLMPQWPLAGEALHWCTASIIWIIKADTIKYRITRDPRDEPFRKWFTFKNLKLSRTIIVKKGTNLSDINNLITAECPRCGVQHGFEKNDKKPRLCGHKGCDQIIHAPHR